MNEPAFESQEILPDVGVLGKQPASFHMRTAAVTAASIS